MSYFHTVQIDSYGVIPSPLRRELVRLQSASSPGRCQFFDVANGSIIKELSLTTDASFSFHSVSRPAKLDFLALCAAFGFSAKLTYQNHFGDERGEVVYKGGQSHFREVTMQDVSRDMSWEPSKNVWSSFKTNKLFTISAATLYVMKRKKWSPFILQTHSQIYSELYNGICSKLTD